jgi:hypothetical protein
VPANASLQQDYSAIKEDVPATTDPGKINERFATSRLLRSLTTAFQITAAARQNDIR